jgi:Ca-activated chloride channel homolog
MKVVWLVILTLLANDPAKIGRINAAKAEAKDAFQSGDYQKAADKYLYLVDSLGVREDEVLLNFAHARYLLKDTANAIAQYQALTQSAKRELSSKANAQLGLMTNQQGKSEVALSYFKKALKDDPTNETARYNYEMLKKKLDDQKKKDQQDQNKDKSKDKEQQKKEQQKEEQEKKEKEEKEKQDKENKDQEKKDQDKKDQEKQDKEDKEKEEKEKKEQEQKEKEEQEKKDKPQMDKQKLEQMKISEEKARMILEAMKNQEKQYLQQNKRKSTKPKDRTKPDW